ncbi:MAG: hypothetical protein F6K24_23570 [Okeania sp. SIO2D1]|nr:hypothetical protein [Okeania sp. SIO2D1]
MLIDKDLNVSIDCRNAVGQDPSMPVDEPPTASQEAGSKQPPRSELRYQFVTLCDALYQFYKAAKPDFSKALVPG